jgi:hypothetical protein
MTPTGSCPTVKPFATGYSPFRICTSVPQIVVVVTRSSASSGTHLGDRFLIQYNTSRLDKDRRFHPGLGRFLLIPSHIPRAGIRASRTHAGDEIRRTVPVPWVLQSLRRLVRQVRTSTEPVQPPLRRDRHAI